MRLTDALRAEYERLFESCCVRSNRQVDVHERVRPTPTVPRPDASAESAPLVSVHRMRRSRDAA